MQKIYLVTKSFPYTNEEKSFLGPEYEFLKKEFEITLITTDISFDVLFPDGERLLDRNWEDYPIS